MRVFDIFVNIIYNIINIYYRIIVLCSSSVSLPYLSFNNEYSTMKRTSMDKSDQCKTKRVKKYYSDARLKEISSIFLSDKKNANILIDLLDQLSEPSKTPAICVSAVLNVFAEVLKRKDMTLNDSEDVGEAESQYKEWLSDCYEDTWVKLTDCLQKGTPQCKLQALNALFELLSAESKSPLKIKKKRKIKNNFPVERLRQVLVSLSLSSNLDEEVLRRFSEFLEYKDVSSNLWIALERQLKEICKSQPIDKPIWNILLLLSKLPKSKKGSDIVLCRAKNVVPGERVLQMAVEGVWKLLSPWQYTSRTHQLLLVVLVEHIMPSMDNSIYLTDYFMDSLNRSECEISMLALQGIFNLVIRHNIEYPDIFGKLYQLFTIDTLKAKYKTRLFALADEFLRSTYLPLALVAAFAKRFSRLLLVATPPDQLILLTFIGNLLIRHPDLIFLYHNPNNKEVEDDPYKEDEKDPVKSEAIRSQLWEVKLLQHHYMEKVAKTANLINKDLPAVEYPLEPLLELTWDKMIEKEVKPLGKKIQNVAAKFDDKPLSSKMEEARQKELKLIVSDFNSWFNLSQDTNKSTKCSS